MDVKDAEVCLKQIIGGDVSGMQNLHTAYFSAVFALALTVVRDYQKAEDVTQDVFIKIWLHADTYRFGNNPKTWIMGITRNAAIDALKQNAGDLPIEDDVSDNSDLEDNILNKVFLEQIMDRLEPVDREIFVLHNLCDMTFSQIGKILKLPLSTVAWKHAAAVKKMRVWIRSEQG
ncbi:MAG: sigma-70 family RNA polymerase sigma factor [Oscillospiraceae bacterium]|nr:sigma-70 family RNA polymerase sigma factor [Oscillospiraceae bacterium]